MGHPIRRRGRSFCAGAMFVTPQIQHEYIRALTAFKSVWTLCVLCHRTILTFTQDIQKFPVKQFLCCCLVIRYPGNVFLVPLSSNGCRFWVCYSDFHPSYQNIIPIIVHVGMSNCPLSSGFSYEEFVRISLLIRATCSAHYILLHLIILTNSVEE